MSDWSRRRHASLGIPPHCVEVSARSPGRQTPPLRRIPHPRSEPEREQHGDAHEEGDASRSPGSDAVPAGSPGEYGDARSRCSEDHRIGREVPILQDRLAGFVVLAADGAKRESARDKRAAHADDQGEIKARERQRPAVACTGAWAGVAVCVAVFVVVFTARTPCFTTFVGSFDAGLSYWLARGFASALPASMLATTNATQTIAVSRDLPLR